MRSFTLSLLLVGGLASGGCFQSSTLITVKGDGSGTLNEHVLFTSAALGQMRQFAALAGGPGQSSEPLSERQARDAADALGSGVTYVSSTPIDTAEGQGRDVTYAFTDINQLHWDLVPPGLGGLATYGSTATRMSFSFARQPDGRALLRVTQPQLILPGRRGTQLPGLASPGQIVMMKPLLAGATLAIAVEPAGRLLQASSPYVDGGRVTLMDISLDEVLKDDTQARLQAAQTVNDARAALKDTPGVKINLDPEITIEFTPTK